MNDLAILKQVEDGVENSGLIAALAVAGGVGDADVDRGCDANEGLRELLADLGGHLGSPRFERGFCVVFS